MNFFSHNNVVEVDFDVGRCLSHDLIEICTFYPLRIKIDSAVP